MTRAEFAQVIAYISLGCGKELPPKNQEVYFDLLGDLPFGVGQLAAKRILAEHRFASFPMIAELRQAAVETMRGEVQEMSPAEAWEIAWKAVRQIDLEVSGSVERALKNVPPLVIKALRTFGLPSLCVSGGRDFHGDERRTDPVSVQRAQFIEIFKQLAARERRAALLPPATHEALADIRDKREAAPLRGVLDGIGKAVTP